MVPAALFPSFERTPSFTLLRMEKMLIAAWSLGLTCFALAQPGFGPGAYKGLESALAEMKMSARDLQFHKDVGEPDLLFDWSREWLHDPLRFPVKVEELTAGLKKSQPLRFEFIASMMEAPPPASTRPSRSLVTEWPDPVGAELRASLNLFLAEANHASALLRFAFESVHESERRYLALSLFDAALNAEDRTEIRDHLLALPIPKQEMERWLIAQKAIDPSARVKRSLDAVKAIRLPHLVEAAKIWVRGLQALWEQASTVEIWPDTPCWIDTELGRLWIGTRGADRFSEPALLILDPAGNDEYGDPAGTANGLAGQALSGIVDLEGRDTYRGEGLLGPGSALFGLSAILDSSGNDTYTMQYTGSGVGLFGAGWLEDRKGHDRYSAEGLGQAAGHVGIGVLDDSSGNDVYEIGYSGQGYAGVLGFGLLVDRGGNDRYLAGGVRPDYERHDDRFLTLAQGFSIGSRPHAGGGFAALVDQEGNDSYVADIYGQGVGYWYAAGALVDEAGNDTYQLHQYGQGAGIHLSLGLLADHAGNDRYTGYVLTQGCAHDYGVGFLLEGEGEDTYTADHYSQGRAMYNSLAILMDHAGSDAYFSRQCDRSQGMGHDGDTREYGSLALLIDLAGKDQYNCGGADGEAVHRPDFGIIYDLEEEVEQ